MISREERRLRGLFGKLIAMSLAGNAGACSTSNPPINPATDSDGPAPARDASADSTGTTPDAGLADGGGSIESGSIDGGDAGLTDAAAACATSVLDGAPADFPDADPTTRACTWFASVPCGVPSTTEREGCALLLTDCRAACEATSRCNVYECGDAGVIPSGPVRIECINNGPACSGVVGRRPGGLRDPRRRCATDPVGAWLSENARLEAASVHAFRRLGEELTALGAPDVLVSAAAVSARDEVRHARVTRRLARRRGAEPSRVVVRRRSNVRSIEAFALENAVEGCVRETFGALIATHQAARAADPELRAAMVDIAADETRHAALAWAISRWIAERLAIDARARVKTAMDAALRALRCEVETTPAALAAELGLPSGVTGAALVDAFAAALDA